MQLSECLNRLDQIEGLPTLPVITRKIQAMLYSDSSNMHQIADLISKDQAISSKVIQLVNSAFYGLRNRVSSIQQGIVLLGLNSITNIVIGISVIKAFNNVSTTTLFNREHFWLHSFATAMGAKLIAIELKREEPEDYFLAGLLHDIGILVMDQFFNETFIHIINYSNEYNVDIIESEKKFFRATHQEIGEYLASKWKLPSTLTNAIRYHHNPHEIPESVSPYIKDITDIVYIADFYTTKNKLDCGISIANILSDIPDKATAIIDTLTTTEIFRKIDKEIHSLVHEWGIT